MATQLGYSKATPVGFEPTRGDPIGLAGRRLNHSAKVSMCVDAHQLDDVSIVTGNEKQLSPRHDVCAIERGGEGAGGTRLKFVLAVCVKQFWGFAPFWHGLVDPSLHRAVYFCKGNSIADGRGRGVAVCTKLPRFNSPRALWWWWGGGG